jgi:hypothetical protein
MKKRYGLLGKKQISHNKSIIGIITSIILTMELDMSKEECPRKMINMNVMIVHIFSTDYWQIL